MNVRRLLAIFGIVVVAAIALSASLLYIVHLPEPSALTQPGNPLSGPTSQPLKAAEQQLPPASAPAELPSSTSPQESANSTSTISVSGMSQYIDSSFGFSFWYPSSWILAQITTATGKKILTLSTTPSQKFISIEETDVPSGHYLWAPDNCSTCFEDIHYDSKSGWLETLPEDSEGTTTPPQDPEAPYTMGGLPIFQEYIYYFVPVTTHRFLQIGFTDAGLPLVQTIESLAFPLQRPDAATVVKQVQAESAFYAHYSPDR
jgi:hypothetical protein